MKCLLQTKLTDTFQLKMANLNNMTGSLLHKMDDILDNITMNDDQHHDNSLISVLGQNALSGWPATIAPAGTLCADFSKDFLALPNNKQE